MDSFEHELTIRDVVISIPSLLISMANLTRSYTIINCSFKGLSVFAVVVAATRLALQYDAQTHRIQYVTLILLLIVENAVAIIMASVSSYRVVVLDHLAALKRKANAPLQSKNYPAWCAGPDQQELDELYLRQ
jgi:hypothetical protein